MNIVQRIFKNTLFLLGGNIIARLFGFVVIVYLARILGPNGFGKISFAMALVAYFALINNMGLPLLGTRKIAREKEKINYYSGNILLIRIFLACLGFGLLLLVTSLLPKSAQMKHLILLYGLGIIPSALLLDWAFQGVERMEYIGLGRILASGIYLALVLWLVKTSANILRIPVFCVTGNIFMIGLLFFIFIKRFGRPRPRLNLAAAKSLLREALPIGLTFIIGPIILYTDTIMLDFMRGDTEVGYYNAACKIGMILVMFSVFYQDAVYPIVSKFYKTSQELLKKVQTYSAKLMVATALPLAVGGVILARPLMNLLYGTDYDKGIIALQILIWFFAFEYTYSVFARGLLACDRDKERLKIITIMTVANVVLNFILIPPFGLKGAAIATVLVRIIGFFMFQREFSKIVPIYVHKFLFRPLLAAIIMAIFLYAGLNILQLNLFWLIFLGAVIYLFSLYQAGGITEEELKLVKRAVLARREHEWENYQAR